MRATEMSKRSCRRPITICSVLAILMLILWTSLACVNWDVSNLKYALDYFYNQPRMTEDTLGEARHLAQRLIELRLRLQNSFDVQHPLALKDLMELKAIIMHLDRSVEIDDGYIADSIVESGSSLRTSLVCPDHYFGPHSIGWGVLNCSANYIVSEMLTVVVNLQESEDSSSSDAAHKAIARLTRDFRSAYPGIRIIIIANNVSHDFLNDITMVSFHDFPGKSWNEAAKRVQTPHVLIVPSVFRFSKDSSPLERLLWVLTNLPGVGAVGGALRNSTGHWHAGCFQTNLKNYVLTYQKGYHNSQNESMFCDYIDGPFIIATSLLRQNALDQNLEANVLFQDFFLNLSQGHQTFMLCPDVMFYANGNMVGSNRILSRESWMNFARKWELNRISIRFDFSGVLHKFSCSDVGMSCRDKIHATSSYTIPVCCQEELGSALQFWDQFCQKYRLQYQIDSGSGLGAVKMADFIPWDIDVDGGYHELNYTFLKSMAPFFQESGLNLIGFKDPKCCDRTHPTGLKGSYMQLWSPSMKIEMWADWKYPYDTFLYPDQNDVIIDTRMELHGVWVNGPPNPGHYARKRYGPECLKHAQNWSQTGKNNSRQPYEAGHFKKCRKTNRHSCLDMFPADGSIAFQVPN